MRMTIGSQVTSLHQLYLHVPDLAAGCIKQKILGMVSWTVISLGSGNDICRKERHIKSQTSFEKCNSPSKRKHLSETQELSIPGNRADASFPVT